MLRSQSGTEPSCYYIILCNLLLLVLRYNSVLFIVMVYYVTSVTVCVGSSNATCVRPQELES